MTLPRLLVLTDRTQCAGPLVAAVAAAVAAGARAVVLRDKDMADGERAVLAGELRALLGPVGGLLVVAGPADGSADAVPMPASRMTGTSTISRSSAMACGLRMPRPLPIGAPNGMTAAHPTSASRRPTTGSSPV